MSVSTRPHFKVTALQVIVPCVPGELCNDIGLIIRPDPGWMA